MSQENLEVIKLVVSVLGFGGTVTTLLFGLKQYSRAENWKRGEFIAKEIKEFESDPLVRNALSMIDWSNRKINLFLDINVPPVKVTRETQWKALLPTPIKVDYLAIDTTNPVEEGYFNDIEVKIRDAYDALLYYFVRFANFIKTGLVKPDELKPYLSYWLESIAGNEKNDPYWQYCLITFINYYDYKNVNYLFNLYGYDLKPDGVVCKRLKLSIKDRVFFDRLNNCVSEKIKKRTSVLDDQSAYNASEFRKRDK